MNTAKAPKKVESLTKSERYALLALRKETFVDVARAIGENAKQVSYALAETKPLFRLRDKIAAHLGLSYEQCWGAVEPTEGQMNTKPRLRLAPAAPANEDTHETPNAHPPQPER